MPCDLEYSITNHGRNILATLKAERRRKNAMEKHEIKFERNVINDTYRATCSCGWSCYEARLSRAQERAALHDLNQSEWEPVEPEIRK